MKIFVLDDDMNRIEWFQKKFGKENVYFATCVSDAKDGLRSYGRLDYIFLDHDLGGPYTRGPDGDGIDVAQWMAQESIQCDTPVVCHSLNDAGAMSICHSLNATHVAIRCDFLTLVGMDIADLEVQIREHVHASADNKDRQGIDNDRVQNTSEQS
jgi:hypothetical protein